MSKSQIVLLKVKDFCRDAIKDAEPIVNGDEVLTDGEEKIYEGRYELAESLLEQIHLWENDDA